MTRRFAEDTAVPISKSRAEIEKLLREWGADGIQWSDHFQAGHVTLRFTWQGFVARFDMRLEAEEKLRERCVDGRTGRVSQLQLTKALDRRGRTEHRILMLWIKAALNAVDLGIVSPEALFLPFLEDKHGHTIAEQVVPKLPMLTSGSALKMLPAGTS